MFKRKITALSQNMIDMISNDINRLTHVEESVDLDEAKMTGNYARVMYDYREDYYNISVYKNGKEVGKDDGYFGANETGNPLIKKFTDLVKKAGLKPEGLPIVDEDDKKGVFKGNTFKWNVKEEVELYEISTGKMSAYAPKAIKSRNDANSATHSADSNRRADAKKTLVKRKAGADNYNKKMWGYANVAPTKESVDEAKLPVAKIQKMVDDGKSMDVIVGTFADKRTTNTDEIRQVVKDYMWKKRMKKEDAEITELHM